MRVYLDTETTGLDSRHCHIVEIGAVAVEDFPEGAVEVSSFSAVCNPGEEAIKHVSVNRALEINGLTREEIRAAESSYVVAHRFRAWLAGLGEVTMHAYNNGFDSAFLGADPWSINPLSWGECVMRLVSRGRKMISLERACIRMGIDWNPGEAHRALYDARQASRVHAEWRRQHQGAVA